MLSLPNNKQGLYTCSNPLGQTWQQNIYEYHYIWGWRRDCSDYLLTMPHGGMVTRQLRMWLVRYRVLTARGAIHYAD